MNSRAWNILCWNVHGLDDKEKWNPIRNKIEESNANIVCLQETKGKPLTGSLSIIVLQKDLIVLIFAPLLVPLVASLSARPQIISLESQLISRAFPLPSP
jgi:hypothetical protein